MTQQEFNEQLESILAKTADLPAAERAKIIETADATRARDKEIRESTSRARLALDDWRLRQKYLLFDAEATLREARAQQDEDV
ncbi:MAG: hypothetical protein GY842_01850 [bacterium]|nr:hypothetical protein [bacterium]